MKKRHIIFVLIFSLLLIVTACSNSDEKPNSKKDETPQSSKSSPIMQYHNIMEGYSPLTGLPYDGDGRAIMVQIENTSKARPQSGISKADIIYEMEVEGKITRLTAFFLTNYPQKVGPIRSVRKQHMYLWSEWDYLYTFYGGSEYDPGQNVYTIKEELGITSPSENGHKDGISFSRSTDRQSPHNAYSDLSYTIEKGYDYKPTQRTLYFVDNMSIQGSNATEIELSYSSNNNIKYVYNDESSKYDRFINEVAMVDKENNKQVNVKNIIIQHAEHYEVEGTPYINMELIGSGEAEYYTDGIKRVGKWERKNVDSLTIYYDEKGAEIPFKPGVTFVQIIREDTQVTVVE